MDKAQLATKAAGGAIGLMASYFGRPKNNLTELRLQRTEKALQKLGNMEAPVPVLTEQQPPSVTATYSPLTSEDMIKYQNREIRNELWLMEKHMAQGGRLPDAEGNMIACDCILKHLGVGALASETIPIAERSGADSSIYRKIANWVSEIEPMVTPEAIERGEYDLAELAGQASALRKELLSQ